MRQAQVKQLLALQGDFGAWIQTAGDSVTRTAASLDRVPGHPAFTDEYDRIDCRLIYSQLAVES
jgi:hypothetical protein